MSALVDRLMEELERAPVDPLTPQIILIPNAQMKQWLLLEIAKRKGIAMGLKLLEIEQLYPPSFNSVEGFCLIYTELLHSTDPELLEYTEGKEKRILDLTEQLTSLFFSYGQFGKALFEGRPTGWQQALLHKLFVQGPWRLPVQWERQTPEPIFCFGIDFLPPVYWTFLFQAPSLSIYLFSPCVHFWEDLCTDRERKNLNRYWEKRGAPKANRDQLDTYLRNVPRNLANWGKMGRETLKILGSFPLQTEEAYPALQPDSLLKQMQFDLLAFQEPQKHPADDSIQLFLTGSSRLKEIECLRDEILRLKIPYCEISVLAPDMEPYVPLIEFVFSDAIPYRISGFDIAPQSHWRQGLLRLLHLASGRWEAEEVLALFETPSFARKQGWDQEKLAQFRTWISSMQIKWGLDAAHRQEVLTSAFGKKAYQDQGSWGKGLDRLLDTLIYFSPLQIDATSLEELICILSALKNLPLKGEKTPSSWADSLEAVAQEFLLIDPDREADVAALHAFRDLLLDLRRSHGENGLPLAAIQRLLLRPCFGQIHSSHLHAVRFAPLEEGSLLPAQALFLIGMDEESFPRVTIPSSLDLLKGLKGQIPSRADRDRYLFLQALFSAEKFLRISYGHLSADGGKPIGPSLLVQELLSTTDLMPIVYRSVPPPPQSKTLLWPNRSPSPLQEKTIPISDLRQLSRHPWQFFLQKVHGISLNESLENSFALQKGQLLRATLEKSVDQVVADGALPPGPLGEALQLEILEKSDEWQRQLAEWQLKPFSLLLQETCTKARWEGAYYLMPPLELCWDSLKIRLVGEIKRATLKGLVCANEDNIAGLLKIWPEALILALSVNAPQIWMLRSGKIKSLENPEKSLKLFIEYYFQCLAAPSPLLPEWADALLRKGISEFEKKREKGFSFKDPVVDWVLARAQIPSTEEIFEDWGTLLKETFAELLSFYPTRGKSHAAI